MDEGFRRAPPTPKGLLRPIRAIRTLPPLSRAGEGVLPRSTSADFSARRAPDIIERPVTRCPSYSSIISSDFAPPQFGARERAGLVTPGSAQSSRCMVDHAPCPCAAVAGGGLMATERPLSAKQPSSHARTPGHLSAAGAAAVPIVRPLARRPLPAVRQVIRTPKAMPPQQMGSHALWATMSSGSGIAFASLCAPLGCGRYGALRTDAAYSAVPSRLRQGHGDELAN